MSDRIISQPSNDAYRSNWERIFGNQCRCGKTGQELHTCPTLVDLEGDRDTLCNCCDECEGSCADYV